MSTQTTGHFGNSTPFETMKPKGSVGRVCQTIVNQTNGDAVPGATGTAGVAYAIQRGYPEVLVDAAAIDLPGDVLHRDASLTTAQATLELSMPTLASILAYYPDLKFGDRFEFYVYLTLGNDTIVTIADESMGSANTFAGAALNGNTGEQHALLCRGFYRDNAGTGDIIWSAIWTNQAIYVAP